MFAVFMPSHRLVRRNCSLKRCINCTKTLQPPLIRTCRTRGWIPTKFIYIFEFSQVFNRNSSESKRSFSSVLESCLGAHFWNEGVVEVHESIQHPVLGIEEVVIGRLII